MAESTGPAEQAEQVTRLAAAQRAHDILAAARAAGSGAIRDARRLDTLTRLARGGPPSKTELAVAVEQVDGAAQAEQSWGGVDFALRKLVIGGRADVAFIQIGPDGLAWLALTIDALGVPVVIPGKTVPWREVLPILSGDADLRAFQLAGGVGAGNVGFDGVGFGGIGSGGAGSGVAGSGGAGSGGAGTDQESAAVVTAGISSGIADLVADALAALPAGQQGPGTSGGRRPAALDMILVQRARNWAVIDEAMRLARASVQPIADLYRPPSAGSLMTIVQAAVRRAPLRYPYELLLASVLPGGMVELSPYRLFPAGAVAATAPELHVRLRPPPYGADELVLPVVARNGDQPKDWPLIQEQVMPGNGSGTTSLTIKLQGPGKLLLTATPELPSASATAAHWADLAGQPLGRLPRAPRADVVFLIELGGAADVVRRRVELVRSVAARLAAGAGSAESVQVTVVGYREHDAGFSCHAGDDHERLVVDRGPLPADQVGRELDNANLWRNVPDYNILTAPVEDALHMVAQNPPWRRRARHVLMTVGSRPPHPLRRDPRGSTEMTACMCGRDWREEVAALKEGGKVDCIAVLEPRPGGALRYDAESWAELGGGHGFTADVDVAYLAQAVLATARTRTRRIPLAVLVPDQPAGAGQGGTR